MSAVHSPRRESVTLAIVIATSANHEVPQPPRTTRDDGVVLFACDHAGAGDFLASAAQPPRGKPTCPTCGRPALHVGPGTAILILDRRVEKR